MHTDISEEIARDPWFKIVDFLQHNWAALLKQENGVIVVFYGDTRGVFDEIPFSSKEEAEEALRRNGFNRYVEDKQSQEVIPLPRGEFEEHPHPNGRIYSSGKFWK